MKLVLVFIVGCVALILGTDPALSEVTKDPLCWNCDMTAQKCVPVFTYDGVTYDGCTKAGDVDEGQCWCSWDEVYDGRWSTCYSSEFGSGSDSGSGSHSGSGCASYYDSGPGSYSGSGDYSGSGYYASGSGSGSYSEEATIDTSCCDMLNSECVPVFTYNGITYDGCTTDDHISGVCWCSIDAEYAGRWTTCYESGSWSGDFSGSGSEIYSGSGYLSDFDMNEEGCPYQVHPSCMSPFMYNDVMYDGCTTADDTDGRCWCSTTYEFEGGKVYC